MRNFKAMFMALGLAYLSIAMTPAVLVREALRAGAGFIHHSLVV